jgi:chemosensory pili system protein ChpA (sensor histidine kinase/response regulator)
MAERHDPNQLVGAAPDVAPLAWVIDEIRASLNEAVNGLKAFVANKQDVDSVRNARNQVHQANGALQLLDLRGVALVTEAVEQLTRQFESSPKDCMPAPVRTVETALSAVMAYLDGLLSGRSNQPIRLFPYYRDVLQLIGATRVHPADLVFPDLSRRPAFHEIETRQFNQEQLRDRRSRFELGLLGFLRHPDDPAPRKAMREALAELEHMPQRGMARSFWWVARGLLEAIEADALQVDVDLKRVLARLNLQLRRMIEGGGAVAERLMIDTLYYVGRAGAGVPRVAEAKRLFGLEALIPQDFESATLTALDADALRVLKDSLVHAKQLWGQIVSGAPEAARFAHEISLARGSAETLLAHPLVMSIDAIAQVTGGYAKLSAAVREAMALEVASALLFVDAGVDQLPQIDPEYEVRAQQVTERLAKVRGGEELPDGGPWMSELARRAQDRLTLGSVVTETQATLREIEQRLDRFFRNPAERADLPATTGMFDQVCGVLALLGYDDPVVALRNVQQSVARFADPSVPAEPEEFSRIAQNLGAVGFFVESVGQDTDRSRGMFHYEPTTGTFSASIGQFQSADATAASADDDHGARTPVAVMRAPEPRRTDNVETAVRKTLDDAHAHAMRLVEAAGDGRAIGELERLLPTLSNEADLLDDAELKSRVGRALKLVSQLKDSPRAEDASELEGLLAPPKAPEAPPPTAPLPSTDDAANVELCEIFVEEAREVLDSISEQLAVLREHRDDKATMTTVRRAFHTLKGSSRMVGFKSVGEGAWGVEQCFNLWLAQERPACDSLIDLASGAQRVIRQWVNRIAVDADAAIDPAALVQSAQRVREGGAFEYVESAPEEAVAATGEAPSSTVEAQSAEIAGTVDITAGQTEEIPEIVEQSGGTVEETPEAFEAMPATLEEALDTEETLDAFDETPGTDEETPGTLEETVDLEGTLDTFEETPDTVAETPATVEKTLDAFDETPDTVAETPDTVAETPATVEETLDTGEETPATVEEIGTVEREAPLLISLDEIERAAALLDDADEAASSDAGSPGAEEVSDQATQWLGGDSTDVLDESADDNRRIGSLEISHGLYSIFLTEADECIRVLATEIAEWRYEPDGAVTPSLLRRAHSLCGISRTVGLEPVVAIVDPLEVLLRALSAPEGTRHLALTPAQFDTVERAIERVRGMLHQFAAGLYPDDAPLESGAVHDLVSVVRAQSALHEEGSAQPDSEDTSATVEAADFDTPAVPVDGLVSVDPELFEDDDAEELALEALRLTEEGAAEGVEPEPAPAKVRDELDPELLEVFLTEAAELLPSVATNLRALGANPNNRELARDLMRKFHTIKGSARMAGAMRLGELVHGMETHMEAAMQLADVPSTIADELHAQYDEAIALYEALQHPDAVRRSQEAEAAADQPLAPVIDLASARELTQAEARILRGDAKSEKREPVSPARTPGESVGATLPTAAPAAAPQATFVRVRADVLDKLVDQAGEVAISRSKLENQIGTIKGSLGDLVENIQRLRAQLREVEIQADAQIQARGDRLSRDSADFDPLEFDRYTRLQELTRLLAESVEDVAMVQSSMQKGLQAADSDLIAQSRLTRDLQQQLMRVRLVPFSNISERLYRVARQASKELDKRVNLDVRGARTELDRGVLDKMAGPFEHLIRNAIVHGLETPAERRAAGKPETGELVVDVKPEGNEIIVVISDDGTGLNLPRIRERAIENELITPDQELSERELMDLIFQPGFTTVSEVTELAGRGVGMDVVRAELASFGGRIAISSEAGRGTRFTLYLPMTLAVAQVVLVKVGTRRYAIPAGMVEQVRRYRPTTMMSALAEGMIEIPPVGPVVLRPLTQLVGSDAMPHLVKQTPVVVLRSGDDRLAISVDDVSSSQEVVVKSVGAQVARLAGILGATILGTGEIVLIVNPVQLIVRAPEPPAFVDAALEGLQGLQAGEAAPRAVPTIMVVDDSLTVRRVTQRLLERQGYNVLLAKDGVDALRQLQDVKPDVMLVDIEMPRMDGYDLTRNVRGARPTADIPIIMITSRTAEKHRSTAFELGVNEYLGKPYQEDELLRLLRQYLAEGATA